MSDRIRDLALFVRVAETGSFSRAGRELGYAQPSVSRMVSALEDRLGVKLLVRTTRQVVPTDAGAELMVRARQLLADVEDVENSVRGVDGLSGSLRIATPVTFGARQIVPGLGTFLAAHPGLRVELLMADRVVDLVEEGVDVAIRLGDLGDSVFVSRRIGSAPRYIVASPAYLAAHTAPERIDELADHAVIGSHQGGGETWVLRDAMGNTASVKLDTRLVATSVEGVLAAAIAGFGLAAVSHFACSEALENGTLVRLLPDHGLTGVDVHAVSPLGRNMPAKVRHFIDHLVVLLR